MQWTNVKDSLPKSNGEYLIIHKNDTGVYDILSTAMFTTVCVGDIENKIDSNSFYADTKFGVKPIKNVTFWIDKKDVDVPNGIEIQL